jgi:predicted nucleic acid-binding protein
MIAVDSSTLIAFMRGESGADVAALSTALGAGDVILPPVTLSEILSDPHLPDKHRNFVLQWPVLETLDGYWIRSGESRAKLLALKLRARLPDTLVAQSCMDHDVPLIARDGDFRHFAKHCGLKLA